MVLGFGRKGKGTDDDGAASMRQILLTRDLTRFKLTSARIEGGEKPKTVVLRSNRLVTSMVRDGRKHILVVRGKSMPGTLRMFLSVLRLMSTMGSLTAPGAVEDLEAEWTKYGEEHLPEGGEPEWIAVYDSGVCIINTRTDRSLDTLEALIIPEPVSQKQMSSFGADYFNKGVSARREVVAIHESQPVFSVENGDKAIKVTILNRKMGRGGQLSFRVPMPRLYDSVGLGTDIVELHNRIAEFEMLKKKLLVDQDLDYLKQRNITPAPRELMETLENSIKNKSTSLQVDFTPAAPEFDIPV